jgi:hypothetical protein
MLQRLKTWIGGAALAATALLAATSANATPIIGGSGVLSPSNTVTFSEVSVGDGSVVTNQFAPFGVTFGSLSASAGLYYQSGGGNPGPGLQNYFPDTYNPFSIQFNVPVSAAAFQMVTNGSTDIITALLNGSLVEQFTTNTGGGWRYYGFTGIVFDEIQVNIAGAGPPSCCGNHMRLDNVQFEPVPLPAALPLMAAGIGSLALLARRRK